jgi:hypothetical protein
MLRFALPPVNESFSISSPYIVRCLDWRYLKPRVEYSGVDLIGRHMAQARTYKAVGVALLVIGAAFLAFGLSADQPASFRIGGPVLAFFGIVLLARAKRGN